MAALEELGREVLQLDRIIDALQRAWISPDDEAVELARHRVEKAMEGRPRCECEVFEAALGRLERARLQARLRNRDRHPSR